MSPLRDGKTWVSILYIKRFPSTDYCPHISIIMSKIIYCRWILHVLDTISLKDYINK